MGFSNNKSSTYHANPVCWALMSCKERGDDADGVVGGCPKQDWLIKGNSWARSEIRMPCSLL